MLLLHLHLYLHLACTNAQINHMDNTLVSWAWSAAKDAACSVSPSQNLRARVACKQLNELLEPLITVIIVVMLCSTAAKPTLLW